MNELERMQKMEKLHKRYSRIKLLQSYVAEGNCSVDQFAELNALLEEHFPKRPMITCPNCGKPL